MRSELQYRSNDNYIRATQSAIIQLCVIQYELIAGEWARSRLSAYFFLMIKCTLTLVRWNESLQLGDLAQVEQN